MLQAIELITEQPPDPATCAADARAVIGVWRDGGGRQLPRGALLLQIGAVAAYSRLAAAAVAAGVEVPRTWWVLRDDAHCVTQVLARKEFRARARQARAKLDAAGWRWDGVAWCGPAAPTSQVGELPAGEPRDGIDPHITQVLELAVRGLQQRCQVAQAVAHRQVATAYAQVRTRMTGRDVAADVALVIEAAG